MIAPADRIALARGVRLTPTGLEDPVRGTTFSLNSSGRVVLSAHTVADAAAALVHTFGAPADRALTDATRFCAQLNERLLLEVAPRGGAVRVVLRWIALVCRLAPLRVLPRVPARRKPVDTSSMLVLLHSGTRALAGAGVVLGGLTGVAALLVVHVLTLALAVALAVGAGLVAHELGHLALLRGVPACVVVRGLRVSVLHRSLTAPREVRVAAAGPCAGIALAALLLFAVELWPRPELATAALVEAAQLLGLTTLTRDGRRVCGAW
jgi:coenzyme PQQ synthesis protein D (PqqD)